MPEADEKTLLYVAAAAGATALLAASKTARVLALAAVAGYGVYRLRGSSRNPWTDVDPPRAR
jgi:2-methylcitrate dehydratase PrpD